MPVHRPARPGIRSLGMTALLLAVPLPTGAAEVLPSIPSPDLAALPWVVPAWVVPGDDAVAVQDGLAIGIDRDTGAVRAVRLSDGREMWRKEIDASRLAADPIPAGAGRVVVAGHDRWFGMSSRTGKVLWERSAEGDEPALLPPGLRILAAGRTILVQSEPLSDGLEFPPPTGTPQRTLSAIEPATGRTRWTIACPTCTVLGPAAPGIAIDLQISPDGRPGAPVGDLESRHHLRVIDAATGRILEDRVRGRTDDREWYATGASAPGFLIQVERRPGNSRDGIFGCSAAGTPRWWIPGDWSAWRKAGPDLLATNDGFGRVALVSTATGRPRWIRRVEGWLSGTFARPFRPETSFAVVGRTAFLPLRDREGRGVLAALDLRSGSVSFRATPPGLRRVEPAGRGRLFLAGHGWWAVVDADSEGPAFGFPDLPKPTGTFESLKSDPETLAIRAWMTKVGPTEGAQALRRRFWHADVAVRDPALRRALVAALQVPDGAGFDAAGTLLSTGYADVGRPPIPLVDDTLRAALLDAIRGGLSSTLPKDVIAWQADPDGKASGAGAPVRGLLELVRGVLERVGNDETVDGLDQELREWVARQPRPPFCPVSMDRTYPWRRDSPLPPLAEPPCRPSSPPPEAILDPSGTWAGWLSGALGSMTDLWVMHRGPSGWGPPRFTGITGHADDWLRSLSSDGVRLVVDAPRTRLEVRAGTTLTAQQETELWETFEVGRQPGRGVPSALWRAVVRLGLAGNGPAPDSPVRFVYETVRRSVAPEDLEADRDGDGWTDLVEARLGTDPATSDTDGDGTPDPLDPSPLCAPNEPRDEDQRLLRDAIAARKLLASDPDPTFVEGLPCLQVPTLGGPMLVLSDPQVHALRREVPMSLVWLESFRVGTAGEPGVDEETAPPLAPATARLPPTDGPLAKPVPQRLPGDREVGISHWAGPLAGRGQTSLYRRIRGVWRLVKLLRSVIS